MDLAKEMTKEALPIKCLEAVILGMYPSSALGGLGGGGTHSAHLGPSFPWKERSEWTPGPSQLSLPAVMNLAPK